MAAYERDVRRHARLEEIDRVAAVNQQMEHLADVYRGEFLRARPPLALGAEPVDPQVVMARLRREVLRGIPWYRRALRKAALREAAERADAWAALITALRRALHNRSQQLLDEQWRKLTSNDPHTVIAAIEAAFEDNEVPAAPLDCRDGAVQLVMRFPPVDAVVPERVDDVTPSGRPTTRKRTKGERNGWYATVLASNVLATVREAFAVAPAIDRVSLLVVREEGVDSDFPGQLGAIYAGRFDRRAVEQLNMHLVEPLDEIENAIDALIVYVGRADEIVALDLIDEPALQVVLEELGEHLGIPAIPVDDERDS